MNVSAMTPKAVTAKVPVDHAGLFPGGLGDWTEPPARIWGTLASRASLLHVGEELGAVLFERGDLSPESLQLALDP